MPIRVNLKEIFPSDSQEITVDKVNFNFNKLLELGVGDPGIQGLSGTQGPAGPVGIVGPAGLRGSTWFVDAGDPNTLTGFIDLIDNDLYLDSITFDVWQYDLATDTWSLITSISTIVNNYLSTASPPFRRGLGLSSPNDDRFITFNRRGETYLDTQLDVNLGTLNPSNNDTLFLNNFNEDVLSNNLGNFNFTPNVGELFNSLLSIYSNHSEGAAAIQGRYHLEMGSLYENTEVSPSQIEMSDIRHNLKAKFLKDDVSLTTPLSNTNYWLNIARFSLGKLETAAISAIDQNGRFEFIVPKYNNEGFSPIQSEVTIRLGSAEALIEQSAVPTIVPDGISISSAANGLIFGLKEGLENDLILPYTAGSADFALFDVSSGLNGFFFNDNLIQSSGSITQLITNDLEIIDDDSIYTTNVTGHYMNQGIFVGSNTIWVSSGAGNTLSNSSIGIIAKYDITNPNLPETIPSIHVYTGSRTSVGVGTLYDARDQHGHFYKNELGVYPKYLGLIKDITEYGKYIVTISNRAADVNNDFAIYETNSQLNQLNESARIEEIELENAYRVHVNGSYAWVITNSTTITGPQSSVGTPTQARLTSVTLLDPANPTIADSYEDTQPGSKYLDFKIADNRAVVLRYTNYIDLVTPANSKHQLDLCTFDIFDPTTFSALSLEDATPLGVTSSNYTPQDTQLLDSFTVNTTRTEYGAVDVQGKDIYAVWEGKLYIIELDSTSTLESTTSLSAEPVYANDIVVRGRYAYVLVNYTDSTGAIQVYDISDKTSPLLVSETRNSSLRNSSRFVVQGKNIYVVSTQAGTSARLLTVDLNGIESPGANIGSIRTTDLQVTRNAHINDNLQVKNSINVGPGGIFVDRGEGVYADGRIVTNISTEGNTITGGFSVNLNSIFQTSSTPSSFSSLTTSIVNPIAYDNMYANLSVLIGTVAISRFRSGYIGNSILRVGQTYRYGEDSGGFIGNQIALGGLGTTDLMYGDFIGSDIILGSGVNMQSNNAYGYKFNFTGTSTGTIYGVYVEGTDANYLEGTTTIDNVLSLTPRATDPIPASNGMLYYNSSTHKLRLYANGSWINLNL